MPHDSRIIGLYETRLRARRAAAWHGVEPRPGTTLSCAALVLATVFFFWSYDAIAHRDTPFVPSLSHVSTNEHRGLKAIETPVPDMAAPEIVRANADVPSILRASPVHEITGATENKHSEVQQSAALRPKKKAAPIVRRISPEAQRAHASAPTFASLPVGGW
jgi:hypothetical protein